MLFRSLAWLTSLLRPGLSARLARPVAFLVWHLSTRLRTVGLINIGRCFPQLTAAEQEQMAREAMVHYARNALEVGICWFWRRERFESLFEPRVGWNHFDDALAQGQGLLFLAPHFGAWEMLGLNVSGDLGATLYKPGRNAEIDAILITSRERLGANLVPANRRGLKAIMDTLKSGRAAGVLPDQEPKAGDGRFAPFYGVPALTGVLVPRLVQRTGARVVFAACVRTPGNRYQVHIIPADQDIYDEDMDTALAALNRGVEACIELDPEQYLWPYKRFRARPEGEKPFY